MVLLIPMRKSQGNGVEDTLVGAGTVAAIRDAMAASNAVGTPTSKLTVWGCRNAAVAKWKRNHQRKRRLLQFGPRADPEKG